MPRRSAAPLERGTENGIACIWSNAERRAVGLGFLGRQPFIVDAIQAVGVNVTLEALHIMDIVREHHHAALGVHHVEIEVLRKPVPQLQGMIVEVRALIIEIVGPNDGRVAPGVSATQPTLFNHRDIGDAVAACQIIGGT